MKLARLKNGKTLQFPEGASEKVIQDTVKRVLGIREEPEIEKVIRDFSEKITEKEKVDFYGPASKEQTEALVKITEEVVKALLKIGDVTEDRSVFEKMSKVIENNGEKRNGIFREFIDIFKKNKTDDRDLIKASMHELSRNMVTIANKLEILTHAVDKNTVALVKSGGDTVNAFLEMVAAYKSPRTIIRDKNGRPEEIR